MKKQQSVINYKKGTETTDKNEILNLVERASVIYAKQQVIYNDKSQSMMIEIHFNPDDKK